MQFSFLFLGIETITMRLFICWVLIEIRKRSHHYRRFVRSYGEIMCIQDTFLALFFYPTHEHKDSNFCQIMPINFCIQHDFLRDRQTGLLPFLDLRRNAHKKDLTESPKKFDISDLGCSPHGRGKHLTLGSALGRNGPLLVSN